MRERLAEEERKSSQLQQLVQQMQTKSFQQFTSLNGELLGGGDMSSSKSLLMEAKDLRMKQLENQINQLQEELNVTKNTIQRTNNMSNENFDASSISNHTSPKQNSSSAASSNSQLELLRNNEKFYKEKVLI